jgi:VRR-NUC domain
MIQNPFNSAGEKTRNQKEFALQCHIVKKHEIYFPHVIMTAFPGRPGDAQDGFFKKMMGVRPGVTDILLWWNADAPWLTDIGVLKAAVVEIKVDARVSSSQNKFMSAIRHIGGKDGVAHSWQEYYKLLCSFGIKPMSACITFDEPCYATEQEKFHAAFEMYRP